MNTQDLERTEVALSDSIDSLKNEFDLDTTIEIRNYINEPREGYNVNNLSVLYLVDLSYKHGIVFVRIKLDIKAGKVVFEIDSDVDDQVIFQLNDNMECSENFILLLPYMMELLRKYLTFRTSYGYYVYGDHTELIQREITIDSLVNNK